MPPRYECRRLPQEDAITHIHDPFDFRIAYAGGSFDGTVCDSPETMYFRYTAPWDSYMGVRQIDAEANRRYIEQAILLRRSDGMRGYGHI